MKKKRPRAATAGETSLTFPACALCGRRRVDLRRWPTADLRRVQPAAGSPLGRPSPRTAVAYGGRHRTSVAPG